jgi:hypothetical protein
MEKTYTRAGISTLKGKTQFRFTNDLQRERVLVKNGHTDIVFYELGEAMTKDRAALFLAAQGITVEAPLKSAPKTRKAKTPTRADDEAVLALLAQGDLEYDDAQDTFVEPKDEAVQVAMSRLARTKPTATAEQLLAEVTATYREFGAYEPTF